MFKMSTTFCYFPPTFLLLLVYKIHKKYEQMRSFLLAKFETFALVSVYVRSFVHVFLVWIEVTMLVVI